MASASLWQQNKVLGTEDKQMFMYTGEFTIKLRIKIAS